MNKLKQAVGRRLISIGTRWANIQGPVEARTVGRVNRTIQQPHSAVVEARDVRQDWTPKQSGNVVIAEPDVMREWRRKNDQM